MIPQSFIQDLLGRVDIVEVIDRHVKLKRAGANYVACCPFHAEKSPSFTVSPTKQFYHCFGCGAHGTAVGFLMEHGGLGFVDAVKELAQTVGMKVPEAPRSERAQRRAEQGASLSEVLLRAAQHYRAQLKDAPHAIAYLKKRGLSGEIARRFGIGYVPDEWQNLAAAFTDYGGKALAEAGLTKTSEDGRRYDVFRNRIMFPIVDVRGNVIGFGGRVLGDGEPKYLNSPETAVFEKGRELYGLYQARRAIREAGRVLVVEGYMDVVALAQAGVEYAVATLGTATTPVHVQKLLRQTDEIVFCFDGDNAGRRAAWRALENSLALLVDGKQLCFLFLPEGEDPDTYVRRHGKAAFEALVAQAVPLSRFLLDELAGRVDLATAEGRARCIHEARPLLRQMQPNALRLQLVRELAQLCRSTPEEVAQLCELAVAPSAGLRPAAQRSAPPAAPRRPHASLAQQITKLLVSHPACLQRITPEQRALFDGPEFAAVVALLDTLQGTGVTSAAAVIEATRDSEHAPLYVNAAASALHDAREDDMAARELADALLKLERQRMESEFRRLAGGGQQTETERQRFIEVSRRLDELKRATAGSHPGI